MTHFIGSMVLALVMIIPLWLAFSIYSGFAVWLLWGWFVVPLGVQPITVAWAIGLSSLVCLLIPMPPKGAKEKTSVHTGAIILKPLVMLAVGYIASRYMP